MTAGRQVGTMARNGAMAGRRARLSKSAGWKAALLELEHQAEHWDTPDHRETGHLIAQALRTAIAIARSGGLQCEHRPPEGLSGATSRGHLKRTLRGISEHREPGDRSH
jgi:hypothetical protein